MLNVQATNGVRVSFASAWGEVSVKQFLKLSEGNSVRHVLECLAFDSSALNSLPDGNTDFEILGRLTFLNEVPDFATLPVPETVFGVKPAIKVGHATLMQKWDAERWLNKLREQHKPEGDDDKPEEERYVIPYTLATIPYLCVYLSPLVKNQPYAGTPFAKTILEQVEALPVTVAFPLGAFFLRRRLIPLSSGTLNFHEVRAQPGKKNLPKWLYQKLDGLKRILKLRP